MTNRESPVDPGLVGTDGGCVKAAPGVAEFVANRTGDASGPFATVSSTSDESGRCGLSKMVEGAGKVDESRAAQGRGESFTNLKATAGHFFPAYLLTDAVGWYWER